MSGIVPTLGRDVWYVLSAEDIANSNGVMVHVGNTVSWGQKCDAIVVYSDQPDSYVNLKVLLDGSDDYWATQISGSLQRPISRTISPRSE